jgi:hypothetical protein
MPPKIGLIKLINHLLTISLTLKPESSFEERAWYSAVISVL